jgi:hypothetical protein
MSETGDEIGGSRRTEPAVIIIFQQNMALLPELLLPNGKNLYLGREREAALESLAYFLLEYLPDLVGLSEMWVGEDRRWLREKLGRFYPYSLEGPGEAVDFSVDGGLLLLSRLPFVVHNKVVYEACLGEDCLAQKGVLHGRVKLFGEAPPLDLFLTHLQNPTPLLAGPDMGPGSGGRGKVQAQLDQLAGYIQASREPRYPALLMGDLNSAAGLPEEYDDLLARLGRPADLWPESGCRGRLFGRHNRQFLEPASGLTFDERSSFALAEVAEGQPSDRHENGKRLDYFLSYPGSLWMPNYISTHLVCLESSPGRDSSDHYGLMTELAELRQT